MPDLPLLFALGSKDPQKQQKQKHASGNRQKQPKSRQKHQSSHYVMIHIQCRSKLIKLRLFNLVRELFSEVRPLRASFCSPSCERKSRCSGKNDLAMSSLRTSER